MEFIVVLSFTGQSSLEQNDLLVMRVKSAVARLNMSPRPMLTRVGFKFTSLSRENLGTTRTA